MNTNTLTIIICCSLGSFSSLWAEIEPAVVETPVGTSENGGNWIDSIFGDGLHRFDVQAERLESDDIEISQYSFQYELQQPIVNASLTLGYTDYDEQYQPAVIGSNAHLVEHSRSIQGLIGWKLSSKWNVDVTARFYDGFASYRSIWIAECYRQLFGLFPTYQSPDSKGQSYAVGVTYNYLSGHSVRLSGGYGRDTIAPGFSFGAGGLSRSRDTLYRKSSTLRFEDVWTPWLKSEHLFNYVDVTNRSTRWGVRSTWHAALGNDWTLRLYAGYSEEKPDYEAEYGGLALEWEFAPGWYVAADVAVYEDTGEIPNAGLVTTSAPGLETMQYGIGLRWVGERSSFRVYVAKYENDYDALSASNQFLSNLYQDRDWTMVQLSYTYQF